MTTSRSECAHPGVGPCARPADKEPSAPGSIDVEQMLHDCVPGGSICDPQQIADAIREWFEQRPLMQNPTAAPLRPVTDEDVVVAVCAYEDETIDFTGERSVRVGMRAALESFRSRLAGEGA